MVNFGNMSIADLRLGAAQVQAAYLGGQQIWGATPSWLRFDILADDTSIDIANDSGTLETPDLEYSVDGGATWTQWVPGSDFPHEMAGAVVYVRAGAGNTGFGTQSAYWHFTSDGLFSVSGNIMFLLSMDGSAGLSDYCFYGLFSGCTTLADAGGLKLPAKTLAGHCYENMFSGCTSLTASPALPAKTLADSCYKRMFYNCQSLTAAPALPATTLASYCYSYMFYQCISLAAAPALPATTLAQFCYERMFYNCNALTTAPALPATTLANQCYDHMFDTCRNLTAAPALPATALAYGCYSNMFNTCTSLTTAPALYAQTLSADYCCNGMFAYCSSLCSVAVQFTSWTGGTNPTGNWLAGVAATGTFTCPAELPDVRGDSNIPTGWTRAAVDRLCFTAEQASSSIHLDKVGSPGAVSLETSTDGTTWTDYAWSGSTGNTVSLAGVGDKVYFRAKNENLAFSTNSGNYYKFVMTGKLAASGNIQTLLKADGSRTDAPSHCYYGLFKDCASLTAAPELPATTAGQNCYNSMFYGCSSLTTAPALPATTFEDSGCYFSMFSGCSSLTTAPALPATTLTIGCYWRMFDGCISLSSAPALPATTLAQSCYEEMFYGCRSLTSAPALSATTLADYCCRKMFYYCRSLTSAPALPATTLGHAYCYGEMFQNCTSLSSVEVAFTAWSPSSATNNWLNNVAASGTFTCPAALPDVRGADNIPNNWTKVDVA